MGKKKITVDFVGIGATKSATTWVAERLREHPDICVSSPKETSFFISDNFGRGSDWYAKHFIHCENKQIKGEFSPQYLTRTEVPRNIQNFAPNTKLIVCLRNPVERFLSGYHFTKATGRHNIPLTTENIETQFKGELERGLYYKYLKKYFDIFPRDQILVLFTENIRKNGLLEIQKTFRFLGVNDNFIPPNISKKENLTSEAQALFPFVNKTIFKWHKKITLGRLNIFVPLLKILNLHLLAQKIRSANIKLSNKPTQNIPIDTSIKEKLLDYYEKDTENLEQLLGHNISW